MRIFRASSSMLIPGLGLLLLLHPSSTRGADQTKVEGEMGGDEISGKVDEGGGDELNFYPTLVHHKFGCVDEGKWKGSCDIDLVDPPLGQPSTILAKAVWGTECDPLKAEQQLGTLTYKEDEGWENATTGNVEVSWTNSQTPNWTCPIEERNPSGCGDFRTDTRTIECPETQSLFDCGRPNNADNRILRYGHFPTLDLPQRHVCVQHPIFYDNTAFGENKNIPPALGRHRERWAKWGEYDFIPPQRWMHNAEHGGAIFLYHPCLDEDSKCALRRVIQQWQDKIGIIKWQGDSQIDEFVPAARDDEDKFRFILTPYKNLWTPFSIVLWGNIYSSKCFNEIEINAFLASHYRTAFEDWPPNGAYNYLWTDLASTAEQCPALPPPAPSTMTVTSSAHHSSVSSAATSDKAIEDLAAQVKMLQQEVEDLREVGGVVRKVSSSAGYSPHRTHFMGTMFGVMSGVMTLALAYYLG
mmetsp:Transcript_43655/g.48916  ORF Transcript_43655/g.48916 Transcript_43655/m.48916 type:complete len:469 (-) Transcript_43655:11-1417(-)